MQFPKFERPLIKGFLVYAQWKISTPPFQTSEGYLGSITHQIIEDGHLILSKISGYPQTSMLSRCLIASVGEYFASSNGCRYVRYSHTSQSIADVRYGYGLFPSAHRSHDDRHSDCAD